MDGHKHVEFGYLRVVESGKHKTRAVPIELKSIARCITTDTRIYSEVTLSTLGGVDKFMV